MPLSVRGFDLLRTLVTASGSVVSKDTLIEVACQGEAVANNTFVKLIERVRKASIPVTQPSVGCAPDDEAV